MQPQIKSQEEIKKSNFFSKLKNYFAPTPQNMVKAMSIKTAYPYGKAYWEIAPKIVKAKDLEPEQKMDLLLDMYGKYYKYQHQSCIDFTVYELYYEEITFKLQGQTYKRYDVFNERIDQTDIHTKYMVSHALRDNTKAILRQISQKRGSVDDYLARVDNITADIILSASKVQNPAEEELACGIVSPNYETKQNDEHIHDLLIERYEEKEKVAAKAPITPRVEKIPVQ